MVSDPASYAGAQIRLVAVDMDGTLLDDEKNFPPGLDELLDHLEQRGVVFVPASGRQVWTLIDMFPERPGLTFIGENGAIVMRDGREISSAPLDLATVRESVRLVRQYALPRPGATAAREDAGEGSLRENFDGGLVVCGKNCAYVERTDEAFLAAVAPYYTRTQCVDDLMKVIDDIEQGRIDEAIIKLAVYSAGDVTALADQTLGRFARSHQFAISAANWADLQDRGVDKGRALRALQDYLGVTPGQTAVFGDAGNDLSMIAQAEFSFAMENASADVRAAARFLAPSNNEAGVVKVLQVLLAE
ncbi:hydrolase [Actinomyces sp. S6-Spd3]|uniref:HAD hydrolase family protein n=1 Tax=Actinomyces sp. S6-Spd3 TaxID=1284680 RepID=UPI00050F0337|nr:HAD hydrolase family protein [Actinomyces sp. S6-Spd3]KGF01057.1 hydrolase [Actinomyces sp. S6-Spd3]